MTDSPTDWNEVKNFYLACRSYKQTAEHFGMNEHSIKTRAWREGWSKGNAPLILKDEYPMNTASTQDEHSVLKNEYSMNTPSTQDEHSVLKNEYPMNTPSTQNVASPLPLLPCLSNFQAQAVQMRSPWEVQVRPRDSFNDDKTAFKTYLAAPETQDCLYSGILGLELQRRVSRDNSPTRLLAIVADYDTKLDDSSRVKKLSKLPIPPNVISTSFSGGTHAIWLLERPLPMMPDAESNNILLRCIAKDLKLSRALGILDERAFYNPSQYYTAGKSWQ